MRRGLVSGALILLAAAAGVASAPSGTGLSPAVGTGRSTPLGARPQGAPAPHRFPGADEAFEAASVKPNRSGDTQWTFDDPPGRIVGRNVVLRDLIRFAYFIYGGDWDIRIAGPDWIRTERFDIDATTAGQVPAPRAMSMLRRLLAERFGMRVHYELRQRPVYALVLARPDGRLGPSLRVSAPLDCAALKLREAGPPGPDQRPICGSRGTPGTFAAGAMTLEQLALQITGPAGRPVLDRTGLKGQFDWDLTWSEDTVSLFTAVQEQLGLRLEPSQGDVEVLVIDAIERPAAN